MHSLRNTACLTALAAALACFAQPALAQDAPAEAAADAPKDGEIIVTAQKRAENVQKIPLAVSVLSPAQIKAAGVTQFQDLGKIAPSLTVRPAEHPVNANVSLRGVGTFAFGIGVEPSVAVLVDEVPLAFQARAFTDLPDVDRIEVLRGPQSTLYGKSASAGLINIITANPTSTLSAKINALATTDSEYGANFRISGPAGENLGFVISGSYSRWDGNVHNLFTGKTVNGREAGNVRAKLRWEPSADTKITLSLNYLNGNSTVGRPFIRMDPTATLRGTAGQTGPVAMPGVVVSLTNQDVSNNFPARTKYQGGGGNVRGEFGLGDMTLISITSYDKFRLDDYLDQDDTSSTAASNIGNNIQVGAFKSSLFTQELRLLSPGDKPFRYTIGAYYGHVSFERPFQRGPVFSIANWFATSRSSQISGFAQADWEFLPHATLTGGGRVQNEKVSYTFLDIANGNAAFAGSAEDTHATWKASLRYEFTPDFNMFATYATGYKGQTFDLTTGFNAGRAAAGPVRPETSRDREIGARLQLLDRRLTFNLTYFNTDYKDLQAQTIEVVGGTNNFRLTNVGGLKTKGVELDTSARIGEDLMLSGSFAYLDAKYTSYPKAQCYPLQTLALGCNNTTSPSFQDATGLRAVQAPEFKYSLAMEYTPALGSNLRGIFQANLQHTSSVNYGIRDPETFQQAYTIVNGGIGIRDQDKKWELVAFVNNLFDQQYFPSLVNSAGNWGSKIATQAVLPRDFRRYGGVRASINF